MTQDEIIALAGADKFCSTEYEEYTHECYEFSIEELERFYHAAQRQAYERAAALCTSKHAVAGDGYDDAWEYGIDCGRQECAYEIRALIEGDK